MPDADSDTLVTPPSELPSYVINPLARQSPERLRAAAAWARELANAKETAEPDAADLSSDSEEIIEVEGHDDGPTVVVKKVPCGKDNCSSCPHGPYRYHVTRDGDTLSWDYRGTAEVGQS